ncbi:hypothetical protein ACP6PL_27790 [Dapis sp. BLCC M126]
MSKKLVISIASIANESIKLHFPKSEIVLACQSPDMKKLTEFAIA